MLQVVERYSEGLGSATATEKPAKKVKKRRQSSKGEKPDKMVDSPSDDTTGAEKDQELSDDNGTKSGSNSIFPSLRDESSENNCMAAFI